MAATFPAAISLSLTDLRPMADRIIVKRDPEKTEQGGIVIPDTSKEKSFWGTVAAIGPDVDPGRLDVGDRVLFGFHSGAELPPEAGERLLQMRAAEIWARK